MSIFHPKSAGRPGLFALALLAGLFVPAFVNAEGSSDVSGRLDVLEFQAEQLGQTLNGLSAGSTSDAMPPSSVGGDVVHVAQSRDVAQLNLRISQLEEQMRSLTGQVEGLQFQMTQYQTLIERLQEDIDFRFQQIDPSLGKTDAATPAGGAMLSGGLPQTQSESQVTVDLNAPLNDRLPADNSVAVGDVPIGEDVPMDFNLDDEFDVTSLEGPSPLGGGVNLSLENQGIGPGRDGQALDLDFGAGMLVTDGDADAQYRAGYEAVVQGDYAFAEMQFRQFVALFPAHPQAPDATNWLGEALLQRGEYDDAAQVLFDGFQRYEQSTRAPDLLLKLGIALAGAGERETACRTFTEVLRRFPHNGGAFQDRVAQEQASAQC